MSIPKYMVHFVSIKVTACTFLSTLGSNYTNLVPSGKTSNMCKIVWGDHIWVKILL